jgi:hypothetical protein
VTILCGLSALCLCSLPVLAFVAIGSSSFEDGVDSRIAGLSIVGACKLIKMLQACDNADITDRNVEEIIQELYQHPEYLKGESIWNTDNREQKQPQEHELSI